MMHEFIALAFLLFSASISGAVYRSDKTGAYQQGKTHKIPSSRSFRAVYRYLRITTIFFGVASLFWEHPVLLQSHRGALSIYSGMAIMTIALGLFLGAKSNLADCYSPCFDSYVPRDIVHEGLYRYVRHPIYSANVLLLTGCYVMTGSLWILLNAAILAVYYVFAAMEEEKTFILHFPSYAEYQRRTGMFIPKIRSFIG